MEQSGLSALGVQPQVEEQSVMSAPEEVAGGGAGSPVSIEEVVKALLAGVSPEELIQAGVPVEVVQQAVEMVRQEAQAQPMAPETQGLSAMGVNA
jgi:hypothetical protein